MKFIYVLVTIFSGPTYEKFYETPSVGFTELNPTYESRGECEEKLLAKVNRGSKAVRNDPNGLIVFNPQDKQSSGTGVYYQCLMVPLP